MSDKEPLYVIKINSEKNEIIVGPKENLARKNIILKNLNLLADRILKLDKHFDLARKDLDEIKISHRKIENRGNVITSIDVSDKKKLTE